MKYWIFLNLAITSQVSSLLTYTSKQYKSSPFLHHKPASTSTHLYGIHEWRDNAFVLEPEESDKLSASKLNDGTIPPREICLLPFGYDEILLQGETKELRLYEDR